MGKTLSSDKTSASEWMEENTKTSKENVTESKYDTKALVKRLIII